MPELRSTRGSTGSSPHRDPPGLGENRVFFLDAEGVQHCLPVPWTDAAEPDVFVLMAAGRCAFRVDDLIALAGLIEGLRGAHPAQCTEDSAVIGPTGSVGGGTGALSERTEPAA